MAKRSTGKRDKPALAKSKKPTPAGKAGARKGAAFVKVPLTPELVKLGAALSAGSQLAAASVLQIEGKMTGGDLYIVKVDGIKVPIINNHGSASVAPGGHWLTTDLVGDVGANLKVTGTINGAQVSACECTVTDHSIPPRHADCADDFIV
jgi:hypothetical protein